MGTLIPLFKTSGDVYSGFHSQSGQPYLHLGEVYIDVCSLRFTPGVTPADLLMDQNDVWSLLPACMC